MSGSKVNIDKLREIFGDESEQKLPWDMTKKEQEELLQEQRNDVVQPITDLPTQEDFSKSLTDDQKRVFSELVDFMRSPTQKMHSFKGYAGTGKTFTCSRFLQWLLANTSFRIAMTATTNKAVKVMREQAIVPESDRIGYATIHSLLGLRENIKSNGEIDFVADKTKPRSIEAYKVLVIDESSMLADDLFKEVNLCLQMGLKVLFVGDPKQIPPVNGSSLYSIPFDEKKQAKYSIGTSELTQIVRQKEGSPIIECTLEIRNRPNASEPLSSMVSYDWNKERGGVIVLDAEADDTEEKLEKLLTKLYKSDKFEQDADYVKVIAWRNATVNRMNSAIRKILYGEKPPVYVIGEKLLANSPILEEPEDNGGGGRGSKFSGPTIVFHTNDEFIVDNIEERNMELRGIDVRFHELTVSYDTYGIKATKKIPVMHKDSEKQFEEVLELIKTRALSLKHIQEQASATWREYYAVKRVFADVKYNYAITAHKSQGSTYQNCIVLDFDISLNNNVSERNRIKYTACSRAAKTLIIVSN